MPGYLSEMPSSPANSRERRSIASSARVNREIPQNITARRDEMFMSKMTLRALVVAMLTIASLQGQKVLASDVAVGPVDCLPNLVHYPTIQHAVKAVTPGSTVNVCAGVYHEQIVISKSLTLQGVANGNQAAAVIYPPLTGLKANLPIPSGVLSYLAQANDPTPPFTSFAAQLAVNGPADVIIRNVTVDGSNNLISDPNCLQLFAGILYLNASGTVRDVVTRNQYEATTSCASGNGVVVNSDPGAGTSDVTIDYSSIHDFEADGIFAAYPGTTVTVTHNFVSNAGNTTQPGNGVEVDFGAAGTVSDNAISDLLATGVVNTSTGPLELTSTGFVTFIAATGGVTFTGNTVSDTTGAIGIETDGTVITSNKISNSEIGEETAGIYICANNTSVTSNSIRNANPAAVFLDNSCGGATAGNIVTSNTINDACVAFELAPGVVGNTLDPNNLFNVTHIKTVGLPAACGGSSPAVSNAVPAVSNGFRMPSRMFKFKY
jgi:hypothetical protein